MAARARLESQRSERHHPTLSRSDSSPAMSTVQPLDCNGTEEKRELLCAEVYFCAAIGDASVSREEGSAAIRAAPPSRLDMRQIFISSRRSISSDSSAAQQITAAARTIDCTSRQSEQRHPEIVKLSYFVVPRQGTQIRVSRSKSLQRHEQQAIHRGNQSSDLHKLLNHHHRSAQMRQAVQQITVERRAANHCSGAPGLAVHRLQTTCSAAREARRSSTLPHRTTAAIPGCNTALLSRATTGPCPGR